MSVLKFESLCKNLVRWPKMLTISIRCQSINLKILTAMNVTLPSVESFGHVRRFGMFPNGHSSSQETETLKEY